MKDRAYAKINLSLDVFNIRDDGYHDIKSIMLPINFYDELTINISDHDLYNCNKTFLKFDERNSVVKMIELLKDRYDIKDHYDVYLDKLVPIKAGLGGGTSDAAAALRIFQRMYKLKMSEEEIIDICLKVGADVPFNYYNVPSIVEGIGDKITPFKLKNDYYVLLVKPKSGVSTKRAYELLDMNKCDHPDIDRLHNALVNGDSIKGLLGNSLEQSALLINDDIKTIKDILNGYDVDGVLMSGSGSTMFCIDKDKYKIKNIYERLKHHKYFVRFTNVLNR